jgi:hypothetical protein
MRSTPGVPLLVATVLGVAIAVPVRGEDAAVARLRAMATLLAKAKTLGVTIDATWDVMQDTGERIEFGERRVVVLRRPDRVRIDVVRRDGSKRGLVFDGAQLTVFDLDEKVYASVSKPGTIDAALDHLVDDLGMRVPLRELLKTDLLRQVDDLAASAHLIGEERLGDVPTDHVALRGDTADLQLWIPREGDPLPKRIVITYRLAYGLPRFEADLGAWDLAPAAPDTLFTFTPAPGAEAIPVLVPRPGKQP